MVVTEYGVDKKYYVYMHTRVSDCAVFYIGKGCNRRAYSHSSRSAWWTRIVKKHGLLVDIIAWFDSETCAFSFEKALIRYIDKDNLCNMTDGGDGASGIKQSPETIAKRMRYGKDHHFFGKTFSESHIKKLSIAHIGIAKGLKNPQADRNKYSFRHIDGALLETTKCEFRELTGVTSSRVSDICNGKRKHSKGWYCSDVLLDLDYILSRGIYRHNSLKESVSIIHKDGRIESGTPLKLKEKLGLCQGHFYSVLRGERKTHLGWSVYE